MASFHPRRFAAPRVLRAVDRARLLAFLDPFRPYLGARGVALPNPAGGEPVPYDALTAALIAPDDATPPELIDALHHVDAVATEDGMAALLAAARPAGLVPDAGDELTPADLAAHVWLRDRALLERVHAEQFLTAPRSFEYFRTAAEVPPAFVVPTAEALAALEGDLNDWFAAHKRGRTARVFAFDRPDGPWFLVRHGEPFKREESVVAGEPAGVAYRPLRYDVLAYDTDRGELAVHAQLKGQKALYRAQFGRHLFGPGECFPDTLKYTLEPLRRGAACLACADVPGLERAVLRELHYAWGGAHAEYEIARAADLFAALRERGGRSVPYAPKLARAVFALTFAGARRPRLVTVKPPNVALYARDEDAGPVERWLRARGFLDVHADPDAVPHPVLARA